MLILQENSCDINPPNWKSLAECGRVADAIEAYVATHGRATFATLQRSFEPFVPINGDRSLTLADPNVFVWLGLSDELADVLKEVVKRGRFFLHPTHWLEYVCDGHALALPVVETLPLRQRYEKPHWLPVALATYSVDAAPGPG